MVDESRLRGEKLKRALDVMYARFDSPGSGRRLSESPHAANAPTWHSKKHNWLVTAVDWRWWHEEILRVARADSEKLKWWADGARGALPESARTGYPLLDARTPPSTLGRALRVTAHSLVNRTPEWELGRGLDEAVEAPNPRAGGRLRLPHWTEAYRVVRDPDRPAATELLAELMSTRESRGRMRRLGEAFFSGTLAIPYAARTTATAWGTYEESTGANYFSAALRYVIYGALRKGPAVTFTGVFLTLRGLRARHCDIRVGVLLLSDRPTGAPSRAHASES